MIYQTRGIVFSQVKYSESSLIVKIYTELFGLQTYMVRGVRKNKSKIKFGYFQPLSLVELIAYHKENASIKTLKEIKISYTFSDLPFNVLKSTIALFLSEILSKSIKEEEVNQGLFDFIENSIKFLDITDEKISDFHLLFMAQLTKFLGFFPHGIFSDEKKCFNLREGVFQSNIPDHPYFSDVDVSKNIHLMCSSCYEELSNFQASNVLRKKTLQKLIEYYSLHLPSIKEINAHKILEEIFS
ncbi:MAG: DNA repair protein RecO [Bacteroidetes bacterium]|nr:DNA repair protein RecO [Bacteroidota bacterium]